LLSFGKASFAASEPDVPVVCKDAPCPEPPPPVFVSFANGLKIESWDGAFSFKIGGRIFVDGGVSSQPIQSFAGLTFAQFPVGSPFRTIFPAHSATGFGNQIGFRQARLEIEGKAWYEWLCKLRYDFRGSPNGLVQSGIRDFWLAWQPSFVQLITPLTVQIGHQFEPSSLEGMASSRYKDFIERAFVSDLWRGDRHVGIAATTGGDGVCGPYGKPTWSVNGGVYSASFEDGNPSNRAVTTDAAGAVTAVKFGLPAGNSDLLSPVPGGHQYWQGARLTYAPIYDVPNQSLLHFGGWVRYQRPNDATAANDDRVLQPGSTLQSEANILNEGLLGTQPLTFWAIPTAQLVGTNCVKNVLFYGAELEGAWGPFSIQGEYIGGNYNRDPNIIIFQGAPGASFVHFSGFYAYATWYLTGESRAEQYRSWEEFNAPGNGNVAQIKILNPWSAGGWGAWELAARVSEINLNSGGFINPVLGATFTSSPVSSATNILNIQGGRQSDFTLGLNWYPDKGIRFMANWINVFQYSAPFNRPDLNGIHPNFFILRAQVDW
jgi:phosphate-selective porin OprO/OprP